MEWLLSKLLLVLTFLSALSKGDFSTGAIQAIRCMMLHTAVTNCSNIPEVQVPSYLIKAFNDSPSFLHDALRSGQLAQLSNDQLANLPVALLYLIPKSRLSGLSGSQLASVMKANSQDTSVANQLASSMHIKKQLLEFILKLKQNEMSQEVMQIIGESINMEELEHNVKFIPLKELVLAYLSPRVLMNINSSTGFDVLLHLRDIPTTKAIRKEGIYHLASMAINQQYPLANIEWLVSGLSPDEIMNDTLHLQLNNKHFKMDLSVAQVRAVFEKIYQNLVPSKLDLMDCMAVLTKLTPVMLQRMPIQDHNFDSIRNLPLPKSLTTACQIQEFIKANCRLTGKLPKDKDELWGYRIRYLGKWIYTLPETVFEPYVNEPLSTPNLLEIESPALSALQTFYLTGKGRSLELSTMNIIKVPESILRGLPSSQLLSLSPGKISSNVVEYLATYLPADNIPRALSWVYFTASSITNSFIFENLLENKDVNTIISLISPNILKASAPSIIKYMKGETRYENVIREFPQYILAALLNSQLGDNWSWQNMLDQSHVTHLLVGGLTCQHIEQMDTGLFIPIIAEYNRHRKQVFPRNLQICSIQKLIKHLEFKMAITQTDSSLGLISMLEPIEIESVGGFVLAGLPVDAIRESLYLEQIISKIGKLSNAELILAANFSHLSSLAQLVVDKEGNADVFVAGNLVWFLPPYTGIPHFKLVLESGTLETSICLPLANRRAFAFNIITEFGLPEEWSAGVVATLKDLLLVFSDEELMNVSTSAWTNAADTWNLNYGEMVNWIKPTPFYQVCTSVLEEGEEAEYRSAVRRLVRWKLLAVQLLLDTVKLPDYGRTYNTRPVLFSDLDDENFTPAGVFDPYLTEDSDDFPESSTIISTSERETSSVTESIISEEIAISTQSSTELTTLTDETVDVTHSNETKTSSTTFITYKDIVTPNNNFFNTSSSGINKLETTTASVPEKLLSISKIPINGTDKPINFVTEDIMTKTNTEKVNDQEISKPVSEEKQPTSLSPQNETKNEEKGTGNPYVHNILTNNEQENNIFPAVLSDTSKNETSATPLESDVTKTNISQSPPFDGNNLKTTSAPLHVFPTNRDMNLPMTNTNDNETNSFSKQNEPTITEKNFNYTGETSLPATQYNKPDETKPNTPNLQQFYTNTSNTTTTDFQTSTEKMLDTVDLNENKTNNSLNSNKIQKTDNQNGSEKTQSQNVSKEMTASNLQNKLNYRDSNLTTVPNYSEEDEIRRDVNNEENSNTLSETANSRKKRSTTSISALRVSCNAIKMVGQLSAIALNKDDLETMSLSEIEDCRVEFGAMDLSFAIRKYLWNRISKAKKIEGTHFLGGLLQAAAVGDIWDFDVWDVSEPWVLERIHALARNVNDSKVIKKFVIEVEKSNTPMPPVLSAVLGDAVCSADGEVDVSVIGFQSSETGCPPCLPLLAKKAVQQLGNISEWTQHHVHTLNHIVAGLEINDWKTLLESQLKPISALQPSAVMCLKISHLEILTPDDFHLIPTVSLYALQPAQIEALNEDQIKALRSATLVSVGHELIPEKKITSADVPGTGSRNLASILIIMTMSVPLIINRAL